jgi:hypothetical protein
MRKRFPRLACANAVCRRQRLLPAAVLLALVVSSAALAALPPAASAALHPGQYTLNTLTLHDSSSGPWART